MIIEPIAYIKTDFSSKFGIPRQSNLVESLHGEIHFTGPYKNPDYLRGIEDYTYLWLIWEFSDNKKVAPSPTVRPPRLGGNTRMGVFATRSPYRPNPLGLSCVKLLSIDWEQKDGPVIHVGGVDLLDGTPIYDIKPYLAFADSHPEAYNGFAGPAFKKNLDVSIAPDLQKSIDAFMDSSSQKNVEKESSKQQLSQDPSMNTLPDIPSAEQIQSIKEILAQDPRPSYQEDPKRIYGMEYAGYEIHFSVAGNELTIRDITPVKHENKRFP